jgi:hypothetical protein
MNEISKFFALTVVAAVVMGATMTANGEKTYGTVDRNIGSGNLGQQNCADAETTNPNKVGGKVGGDNSQTADGGNYVGGDLNINNGNTDDRNVGQQNCADAETTNPNNGAASERENGGNFVGGDLNISSGD